MQWDSDYSFLSFFFFLFGNWDDAELLHLDPKSPEAQVFYQLEKNSAENASAPAQSPTGKQ